MNETYLIKFKNIFKKIYKRKTYIQIKKSF